MKFKLRKIIAFVLTAVLILGTTGKIEGFAKQKTKKAVTTMSEVLESIPRTKGSKGKNYVIMTKEGISVKETLETAVLTKEDAKELREKFEDVIIEEDFDIIASTTEKSKTISHKQQKKALLEKWHEAEKDLVKENEKTQWNLLAINANDITTDTVSSRKPKVAVLDSGIDFVTGIDLSGTVNLVEEEKNITPRSQDLTGHGTSIASVIAGNEENVVQGVNPNIDLYSVKVLDKNNVSPISRVIEGIYWCIENDINIINMSFSSPTYSHALKKAVEDAYKANILMVGASGNRASGVEYPAAFDEVMAVAATNTKSEISSFSNMGEELDVAAPGEKIKVLGHFGFDGVTHGTSIAVPQVVGVASLLWGKDLSKSNEFIRQLITYSTKNISSIDECGLLDAQYALDIYDDFENTFEESGVENTDNVPKNTEAVKSFEYVNDDEAYVEGKWGGHIDLTQYGLSQNKVIDNKILAIIKEGSVYPDKDEIMVGSVSSEYHGGSDTNYISCYEYLTKIALNNGKSSGIPRADVYGLSSDSYSWIKVDFDSTWVGSSTWKDVFAGIKVNNVSVGDSSINRKYFTWGIALHVLQDIFAHATYRKSDGKKIIHGENPKSGEIRGADDKGVVKGRWKAAELATKESIDCMLLDVYGDYCEIDYALKNQTYTDTKQLFLKKSLLKYAESNAGWLTTAETNRFKTANIN